VIEIAGIIPLAVVIVGSAPQCGFRALSRLRESADIQSLRRDLIHLRVAILVLGDLLQHLLGPKAYQLSGQRSSICRQALFISRTASPAAGQCSAGRGIGHDLLCLDVILLAHRHEVQRGRTFEVARKDNAGGSSGRLCRRLSRLLCR